MVDIGGRLPGFKGAWDSHHFWEVLANSTDQDSSRHAYPW